MIDDDIALDIIMVVLPTVLAIAALVGFLYLCTRGVNTWLDLSGKPFDEKESFYLPSWSRIDVFYPETIRASSVYSVEFKLTPSVLLTNTGMLVMEIRSGSDYAAVISPSLKAAIGPSSAETHVFSRVITHNPRVPPREVQLRLNVGVEGAQEQEQAVLHIKVDSWTQRLAAIGSFTVGALGIVLVIKQILGG